MRILLHGAINGTNFGDCLFASIFYKRLCKEFGVENVYFYDVKPFGIGDHLRKTLHYDKKLSYADYKNFDAFVYISGGYFGDGEKNLKNSVIRYLRYIIPGLYAVKKNIDIYVVGLEVGPVHYSFVRKSISKILLHSKLNIVRNEDSKSYVNKLGITNVLCTADTAISLKTEDYMDYCSNDVQKLISGIRKKIVFFHLLPSDTADERLIECVVRPLTRFVREHKDYCIMYGTDGGKQNNDYEMIKGILLEEEVEHYRYNYTNIYDMCYFLSKVSIIVTRKLHVGIIGATFGKSVISTPMHLYKTTRFYKQIGEEGRCVKYNTANKETLYNLLSSYVDAPICIPTEVADKANLNIELLIEYLKKEF